MPWTSAGNKMQTAATMKNQQAIDGNDAREHRKGWICHHADEEMLRSPLVIDSAYLLAGRKEVYIRHAREMYRLRVTKNGKLILNK